jgi:hypothetical protein
MSEEKEVLAEIRLVSRGKTDPTSCKNRREDLAEGFARVETELIRSDVNAVVKTVRMSPDLGDKLYQGGYFSCEDHFDPYVGKCFSKENRGTYVLGMLWGARVWADPSIEGETIIFSSKSLEPEEVPEQRGSLPLGGEIVKDGTNGKTIGVRFSIPSSKNGLGEHYNRTYVLRQGFDKIEKHGKRVQTLLMSLQMAGKMQRGGYFSDEVTRAFDPETLNCNLDKGLMGFLWGARVKVDPTVQKYSIQISSEI